MSDPVDQGGGVDEFITISKTKFDMFKDQILNAERERINELTKIDKIKWEQEKSELLSRIKVMNESINALNIKIDTLSQNNTAKNSFPSKKISDIEMSSDEENSSNKKKSSTDLNEDDSEWDTATTSKRKNRKRPNAISANQIANKTQKKEVWPNLPKTSNLELQNKFKRDGLSDQTHPVAKDIVHASSDMDITETIAPKKPHVPPVVIRNKAAYQNFSNLLKINKINVIKATTVTEGVKLHPETPKDYNKMLKLLETEKIPFHSFRFPDEKELHVVLRGILEEWSCEKIKIDLEELNFTPSRVIRWYRKDGTPMPLVLVFLPKTQKAIFELKNLDHMTIRVETQRSEKTISQCHRCQLFGHSQFRCSAPIKCLKCAKSHFSSECTLVKDVDVPTCANCEGPHTSNSINCPKHPANRNLTKQTENNSNTKRTFVNTNFKWGQQDNNKLKDNNKPTNSKLPGDLEGKITEIMQITVTQFTKRMQFEIEKLMNNFAQNYRNDDTN